MDFIINNWLYILGIGVMFFMMIKGGGCCGGHSNKKESNAGHSHGGGCCGGGSKHNHEEKSTQQVNEINAVKDPTCGMDVDVDTGIKQKINGEEYYFCSEACRRKFVKKQNLI